MKSPFLKLTIKTALVTAGVILLYQISNLLLIYHYFTYEYYITAVGIVALITGFILTKGYLSENLRIVTVPAEALNKDCALNILTSKELQILELIHQGNTNKEIAALNFVELSTIKTHINNIYAKLKVRDRKEASKAYTMRASTTISTFSPPSKI